MSDLRLDPGRESRTGIAEAIYAPGKSPEHCAEAVGGLLAESSGPVVLTRATPRQAELAIANNPGARQVTTRLDPEPLATLTWRPAAPRPGRVALLTAGTADLPVAREAQAVLAAYGYSTEITADVGVAGIHRLLERVAEFAEADVVIVLAGMEGALASVVTGLTRGAVIAVPTSTGYGAGLDGLTALLGMLASCSPGVTVVGIDNGFGAACAAIRVLGLLDRAGGEHR